MCVAKKQIKATCRKLRYIVAFWYPSFFFDFKLKNKVDKRIKSEKGQNVNVVPSTIADVGIFDLALTLTVSVFSNRRF